jgi:hypothetical protein
VSQGRNLQNARLAPQHAADVQLRVQPPQRRHPCGVRAEVCALHQHTAAAWRHDTRCAAALRTGLQQHRGSENVVLVGGRALLCRNSDKQRWLLVAGATCSLAGAPDHSCEPHLQQRGRLLQQHGGITTKPPGPSLLQKPRHSCSVQGTHGFHTTLYLYAFQTLNPKHIQHIQPLCVQAGLHACALTALCWWPTCHMTAQPCHTTVPYNRATIVHNRAT